MKAKDHLSTQLISISTVDVFAMVLVVVLKLIVYMDWTINILSKCEYYLKKQTKHLKTQF